MRSPVKKYMGILLLAAALASAGCGEEEGAVGIYKTSLFTGEWLLMGTLHGWVDDYDVCLEIIGYLEREEPGRYACRYL